MKPSDSSYFSTAIWRPGQGQSKNKAISGTGRMRDHEFYFFRWFFDILTHHFVLQKSRQSIQIHIYSHRDQTQCYYPLIKWIGWGPHTQACVSSRCACTYCAPQPQALWETLPMWIWDNLHTAGRAWIARTISSILKRTSMSSVLYFMPCILELIWKLCSVLDISSPFLKNKIRSQRDRETQYP